ncbi:Phosphofurin acidic cluster sorting protein 2 [Trichoplax sp. H2]|nr:Phosphofurin acidic cluster sorting protein 2 [Trichoplax sp. H2]|eukprot:RDD42984.1 Phosphofurin acidic cluster sorting protein 2 [Trichoplax sp. H2]
MASPKKFTGVSSLAPPPMKFFATWEVDRAQPNCVPRLCVLRITRLEITQDIGSTDGQTVFIGLSFKVYRYDKLMPFKNKHTLRSGEIPLKSSNKGTDIDLSITFTVQYPHYLKEPGCHMKVILQRRKRYKRKAILGFKTLAFGSINMNEVLQSPVKDKVVLQLYCKDSNSHVAQIVMSSVISQPVEVDLEDDHNRTLQMPGAMSSDEDIDSSDQDDEVYDEHTGQKSKSRSQRKFSSKNAFRQKFQEFLRKFKVNDETLEDTGIAPRNAEAYFPDDSISENDDSADFQSTDSASDDENPYTPKPALRPFYLSADVTNREDVDPTSSPKANNPSGAQTIENRHASAQMPVSDSDNSNNMSTIVREISASGSLTRSWSISSLDDSKGSNERNSIYRTSSVGLDNKIKRDKSPSASPSSSGVIEVTPPASFTEQLISVVKNTDQYPESIILIDASSDYGLLIGQSMPSKRNCSINVNGAADVRTVMIAIISKIQKFCNHHSVNPPLMKVTLIGGQELMGMTVKAYVDEFSTKPPEWQNFITFLLVPTGPNPICDYLGKIDQNYSKSFLDTKWKEIILDSDGKSDKASNIDHRVSRYISRVKESKQFPIAEALISCKQDSISSKESTSEVFVPFIATVGIGIQDTGAISGISDPSGNYNDDKSLSVNKDPSVKELISQSPSGAGEHLDLQVDYWITGGKKESAKSSIKGGFKSLMIRRLSNENAPNTLAMEAVTKEKKKAVIVRLKKVKESGIPINAMVSKLICTTKSQSNKLTAIVDGVEWSSVKFISFSTTWRSHTKYFPVGVFDKLEATETP